MAYRKWVRTCGLSRSKLSNYWYSLMEEDSEYGEDSDNDNSSVA